MITAIKETIRMLYNADKENLELINEHPFISFIGLLLLCIIYNKIVSE